MTLEAVSTGLGALATFLSIFRWVKEGEVGVMTTFGKAKRDSNKKVVLVKPGFVFIFPVVQGINKLHVKKNSDSYSGLSVTLKNGLSYNFNAYVVYWVKPDPDSIENVLFVVEDYKQFVALLFEKCIQEVLQGVERLDAVELSSGISDKLRPLLDNEGIHLESCGLISFAATEASQHFLGINYKLELAKESKLPENIVAAAIGATPVVTSAPKSHQEMENTLVGGIVNKIFDKPKEKS